MALPAEIAESVVVVKVRSAQAYVLEIVDGGKSIELLWGQEGESALKVKVYKALIAQPENSKIFRIDLTAPHVCLRSARTLRSPYRKTLNYKAQVEVYGSQGGETWLHRRII